MQLKNKKNWKKSVRHYLAQGNSSSCLTNADMDAAALPVLKIFSGCRNAPMLCIVPDLAGAERIYAELNALAHELEIPVRTAMLPETVRGRLVVTGGESERARVLHGMLAEPPELLVASIHAMTAPAPPPERIRNAEFTLRSGMEIPIHELLAKLVELDYDDELEVSVSGEFSRRGGIVDIYSPAHDEPCRIEFFGDEIESMRQFDPATQRSTGRITAYRIIAPHPTMDADRSPEEKFDAFDYLDLRTCRLLMLFPRSCCEHLSRFDSGGGIERMENICRDSEKNGLLYRILDAAESAEIQDGEPAGCYPPLAHIAGELPRELRYGALELMREMLMNRLKQWLDTGYTITLTAATDGGAEHLALWQKNNGFCLPQVSTATAAVSSGFLLPEEKHLVLTERELFTANAFARPDSPRPDAEAFRSSVSLPDAGENTILSDLDEGDYAVHLDHGIARFCGIAEFESRGIKREIMKLEYRDGAMLHVPLTQSHLISRYLGAAGRVVLHKLGSGMWSRDKAAAGRSVRAFAADMLRFQAVRAASPGIAFPPDDLAGRLFEGSFPYTDTPDQTRSAAEIKKDMEQPRPMDRLLCGDVGYGKTELAMRAAFKAVAAGYQVAVLAPTTVLVQQHFNSFRERFAEHPFTIDMLSRFRPPAEQAQVLSGLESGGTDIVIGTHRLCGSGIKFRNLGLVIIDEEQRFGVKHKDMLRRLRTEVDVLTMSATPIPRTLYLAMAGARDLSTLQTAPRARRPVKTIVAPEEMELIAEAVRSELARGGQVYYLHNRVASIEKCRDKLASAMPDVRFGIAHGQMNEAQLGKVMDDFMQCRIDCLVCSTIIESGLDIPNANTIIIERADRFGLAELYQLRGRVGRRSHQAYAYMLLPKDQILTSDARKRLAAIRRCSELGSGFQLALRDLEIRGAGNILGSEQSGHLNAIGFELYCRLLKNEVAQLQGNCPEFLPEAEVAVDFTVYGHEAPDGTLPAAFPPGYIDGVRPRIAAYRRLGKITSLQGIDDFASELRDRYGKLPPAAENLLMLAGFRIMTAMAGYDSLTVASGKVMLQKNGGTVYRENGKVPYIDYINPPLLRMVLLRDILRRAAKAKDIQ